MLTGFLRILTAADNRAPGEFAELDADPHCKAAKDAVLYDTLACMARFKLAVDNMLVLVDEYRGRQLMQLEALSREREKALEAQMNLLVVSSGQLAAFVSLCRAAVASGDDRHVKEAAQAAKTMGELQGVPTRPCTDTRLTMRCDLSVALTHLDQGTQLQRFEVDAAQSSVSGDGLFAFVSGKAARNVILVTCRDSDGVLAAWATLEQADVGMTVNGVVWQVASALVPEPGVIQITYVVEEEGWEVVEVGVSLCGVAVPGGPWRAHTGFMATGVHIATLPTKYVRGNAGLAITSDGSLMVVSNANAAQLSVYRTVDGSHVRSFGSPGMDADGPIHVGSLCMTTHDTVLVVETNYNRIQEVTLEGVQVKSIAMGESFHQVAVHGDLMAVLFADTWIRLYSYTTGVLMKSFDPIFETFWSMTRLCFTPDGKHLAHTMPTEPVAVMSTFGECCYAENWKGSESLPSKRHFSLFGEPDRDIPVLQGLAFTSTQDLVTLGECNVQVYSATDGKLLRSWEIPESRGCPTGSLVASAVSCNRLYILYSCSGKVRVFQ